MHDIDDGGQKPPEKQTGSPAAPPEKNTCLPKNANGHVTSGERKKAPDGGWGWVILVATFFNYIVVSAIWFSFSVLYKDYAEYFNTNLAFVGILASLEAAAMHFTGAFCSGLVEKYGSRPVAFVGSFIAGVALFGGAFCNSLAGLYVVYTIAGSGIGLSYISFTIIVQQYFHKKRAIASGFSLTGFSIATFSLPPFTKWLLDTYGWRGTLMIIGGVYLNGMVLASLLRPLPAKYRARQRRTSVVMRPRSRSFSQRLTRQLSAEKTRSSLTKCGKLCQKVFDYTLFRNRCFLLYGFGTLFSMIGNTAFIMHLVNKAIYLNIEEHLATFLPSIYGIMNGVSRMLFSFIANMPCSNRTLEYGLWIIFGGLVSCIGCAATEIMGFSIVCAAFGVSVGCYVCVQYPALVDIMGVSRIARSTGLLQIFIGTGGLVATPLAGWIYDYTKDYNMPYLVSGSFMILGGLIITVIPCIQRHDERKAMRIRRNSTVNDPERGTRILLKDGKENNAHEIMDVKNVGMETDACDEHPLTKTCQGHLRTYGENSHPPRV